jgi:hypothetical protein
VLAYPPNFAEEHIIVDVSRRRQQALVKQMQIDWLLMIMICHLLCNYCSVDVLSGVRRLQIVQARVKSGARHWSNIAIVILVGHNCPGT